ILDGDQPAQDAVVVDQRQALTLVLAQHGGRLLRGDVLGSGEQLGGHHVADAGAGPVRDGDETQVAVGADAQQAVLGVDHGQTGDPVLAADGVEVLEGGVGADGDRVGDAAGLGALDQVDLVGLVLDGQVAVQDADAAVAGHGDGHPSLGDRVHGGAGQGGAQGDLAGQAGGGVRSGGDHVGLPRQEQDVVVGQSD